VPGGAEGDRILDNAGNISETIARGLYADDMRRRHMELFGELR
jgi:hypothetical protein